jgi:hypothetical protein
MNFEDAKVVTEAFLVLRDKLRLTLKKSDALESQCKSLRAALLSQQLASLEAEESAARSQIHLMLQRLRDTSMQQLIRGLGTLAVEASANSTPPQQFDTSRKRPQGGGLSPLGNQIVRSKSDIVLQEKGADKALPTAPTQDRQTALIASLLGSASRRAQEEGGSSSDAPTHLHNFVVDLLSAHCLRLQEDLEAALTKLVDVEERLKCYETHFNASQSGLPSKHALPGLGPPSSSAVGPNLPRRQDPSSQRGSPARYRIGVASPGAFSYWKST